MSFSILKYAYSGYFKNFLKRKKELIENVDSLDTKFYDLLHFEFAYDGHKHAFMLFIITKFFKVTFLRKLIHFFPIVIIGFQIISKDHTLL